MRMVLPPTDYRAIDTTSTAQAITLSEVKGKHYAVKNTGTGTKNLTVNYGTDSIAIQDGDLVYFIFDGTDWSCLRRSGFVKEIFEGPMSTVGVSQDLNEGEKFSDWDLIKIDCHMFSPTNTERTTTFILTATQYECRFYSDVGKMVYRMDSDTTFRIQEMDITGNLSRITGIKL